MTLKLPHLDFTDRLDFDRTNGTLVRHEIYVTGSYGRSSLQIGYVQLPAAVPNLQLPLDQATLELPAREQLNIQGDINFYENWQAFAAIERDLWPASMLDSEYGLGYEDECLAVSAGLPPQIYRGYRPGCSALDLPDPALFAQDGRPAGPTFQPFPQKRVQHRPSLTVHSQPCQLDRTGKLLILRHGLGATGVAGARPKRHARGQTL